MLQDQDHDQHTLKNIGWGTDKPNLRQIIDVRCLAAEDRPFKNSFEHEKTRIQMYTTGYAAGYVDNQLGLTYEDIENMPVREQREIVKERAGKMHKMNRLKYKF